MFSGWQLKVIDNAHRWLACFDELFQFRKIRFGLHDAMDGQTSALTCPNPCFQLGVSGILIEPGLQNGDMQLCCLQVSHLLCERERTVPHGID